MAKVLIATPTYYGKEYCIGAYVNSLNNLNAEGCDVEFLCIETRKKKSPTVDKALDEIKYKKTIIRLYSKTIQLSSRQILAYSYDIIFITADAEHFDYLFVVESDVIIPQDALQKLISTSKKYNCISVGYTERFNGQIQAYKPGMTIYGEKTSDDIYKVARTPYRKNEITKSEMRIGSATLSCVLFPNEYFITLMGVYDAKHFNHPDVFLYKILEAFNIPVYLNSEVKCLHLQKGFPPDILW